MSVVEQAGLGEKKDKVERIVLCTGKVAVDLATEIESSDENYRLASCTSGRAAISIPT